ncbi:sulfur carrier protein ThiS [Crocinitomix catalasitica]|nr:sulfur carrier protein ThiS [Crocinitomix catalasitica]
MKVYLNDKEQTTVEGEPLQNFLAAHQLSERNGIAVALNNEVIPKNHWKKQLLKDQDKIMIITATAGG